MQKSREPAASLVVHRHYADAGEVEVQSFDWNLKAAVQGKLRCT